LTVGAFSVTTLVLRPWAGRWTDRHGRRLMLVGGAAAFALLVLGHLLVSGLPGLALVRLTLGVAEACYFVAGFAALADLAPPGRAGEALSLNSLALYVGLGAGPLLGQGLIDVGGYPAAWWGVSALMVLAAGLAFTVPETRGTATGDSAPAPLLHPEALVPGAALGSGIVAMSAFMAFSALHSREIGVEPIAVALAVFGATVVVCRLAFARLPDRVEPVRMVAAALVASAGGMVLIGAAPSAAGLLGGAIACGVGSAFVTPAVFALVFRTVPAGERGSAAATVSLFLDLGLSGGPVLLGAVAALTGLGTAFAVVALMPAAGAVTLVALAGRRPHAETAV
jgi:MFS family permease